MRNVRILDGSGEMRLQFEIKDERRLRALDMREVDRIELYVAVADSPPASRAPTVQPAPPISPTGNANSNCTKNTSSSTPRSLGR
jgi:hypothetical protein